MKILFAKKPFQKKKKKILPGHPLMAIRTKTIEHDGNLHILVSEVPIVVTQKHDLVLVPEPVI